jgi:hypothetical protein
MDAVRFTPNFFPEFQRLATEYNSIRESKLTGETRYSRAQNKAVKTKASAGFKKNSMVIVDFA